jgi:NADH-quinone oxidoreductase subunit G
LSDIPIEIDGRPLMARPNTMVMQAADEAGIYIPRFCYHKHLSIAANCRMCLVEMEKSPKPVPACATPVTPGMKILTRSPKALAAQKAVMEFLLINHPLQDLSMGYGPADSYFTLGKRAVTEHDIGPLIKTEMTRCIQCTRCVRFGDEVAGLRELGATGRGEHMEIGTYIARAMQSEISGNVIDLCPVGALVSKPFLFMARAWELQQFSSISPHDCLGTHIHVHTRNGKVMRVVPRENQAINETWIADRDRYSYLGLYHPDRVTRPLVRYKNQWQETDWQTALECAANGLRQVIDRHGAQQLAGLAAPGSTTEEFYLLQKWLRQCGSPHVDHRLRQIDFIDQDGFPLFPGLSESIAELEQYTAVLLIGSHLHKEQPLAAVRIRKASLKGAKIFAVNMVDYQYHFELAGKKIAAPHHLVAALAGILKALVPGQPELKSIEATSHDHEIAAQLRSGTKACILLGAQALHHPQAALLRWLGQRIAETIGGTLNMLTEGGNAAGAWLAGAVPHRGIAGEHLSGPGLDAQGMLDQARRGYLLLNVEPDLDLANPVAASRAFEQAEFIVSLSIFKSPCLEKYAKVILPVTPFTEMAGTLVNITGSWQSFNATAKIYGEARPAWKVLRVLGNLLDLPGFDYESVDEVLSELKSKIAERTEKFSPSSEKTEYRPEVSAVKNQISRVGEIPLYAVDGLVRRAAALQAAQGIMEGTVAAARVNSRMAERWHLKSGGLARVKQGSQTISLPVVIDERVPDEAVLMAGGISETAGLSELFGPVELASPTDER